MSLFTKKINDLYNQLEKNIDVRYIFPISDFKAKKKLGKQAIKDLYKSLKKIDLRQQKIVQYYKNLTNNFDGIGKQNKRKIVDISIPEISIQKRIQNFKNSVFSRSSVENSENILNNKKEYSDTTEKEIFKNIYENSSQKSSKKWNIPSSSVLIGVVVFFILYIASSRFIVENQVRVGYEKLSSLGEMKSSLEQIESQVGDAKINFYIAKIFFLPYYLIPTQQVTNGKLIINGGIQLTSSLKELLAITNETQAFVAKKGIKEVKFSQLLINIQPTLIKVQQEIGSTIESYSMLKLDDQEMQKKFESQVKNLETIYNDISNINANYDTILSILGHKKEKKYLIIFQNSDEIRPTGGFMGSMAILGLYRGQITEFSPKDVYDLEWNLKLSGLKKEPAPEGLNKITDSFGLRDSNYFINFDENSKKIRYFTEKAGFPIDGIIYLNHTLVLDLLKTTGAVDFKKIGEKIDENNFSELISIFVEAKKFKSGTLDTPKQILFDFAQTFLGTLQEQKQYKKYVKILAQNLENREIVFYPFDKKENEFMGSLNFNGTINYASSLDYSYPVFTSISGNKSDRYIKRTFEKSITKNPNCSIDTTLRISQSHTFKNSDEERIKTEFIKYKISDPDNSLLTIQGKGTNKQYVRVLLPKKADIKPSKDIKIETLPDNKSVDFYTEVSPGETQTFDISYSLPNPACDPYTYTFYKQPGIKDYDIKVEETGKQTNTYKDLENDFYYEVKKN